MNPDIQANDAAQAAAPATVIARLTHHLANVPEDRLDLFLAKAVLLSGAAMSEAQFEAVLSQAAQDL